VSWRFPEGLPIEVTLPVCDATVLYGSREQNEVQAVMELSRAVAAHALIELSRARTGFRRGC
jgi:hypothetical protein